MYKNKDVFILKNNRKTKPCENTIRSLTIFSRKKRILHFTYTE